MRVLCLDELFVTDIADAMLLAGLFEGLIDRGVWLVFTSNAPPWDLYRDGLQRQRFLPAYDMLDVRAGWDFGPVAVELFGRNLTDDDGKTSDATGNTPNGAIATGVIRPRSYGVTVTAEF